MVVLDFLFASYVIYSIKQTNPQKRRYETGFASYVIYSIKQTGLPKSMPKHEFASYVIYSIKQTCHVVKPP